MSKLELFQKLYNLIRISNVDNNPAYRELINISLVDPKTAYKSDLEDECRDKEEYQLYETYPNRIAIRFLLEVCEDVLWSTVPNKKDQSQLVMIALGVALDRCSSLVHDRNILKSDFSSLHPLLRSNSNQSSSINAEIRNVLDRMDKTKLSFDSAITNFISVSKAEYVPFDIAPEVCLLHPYFCSQDFKKFTEWVKFKVLGYDVEELSDNGNALYKRTYTDKFFMIMEHLGLATKKYTEERVESDDIEDEGELQGKFILVPTQRALNLNVDFEKAIAHWSRNDPDISATHNKVSESWFNSYIKPHEDLVKTIIRLFTWDNFHLLSIKNRLEELDKEILELKMVDKSPSKKTSIRAKQEHDHRITEILETKKKLVAPYFTEEFNKEEWFSNSKTLLNLINYGLIQENPLHDLRDSLLQHNPKFMLSPFGISVASYIGKQENWILVEPTVDGGVPVLAKPRNERADRLGVLRRLVLGNVNVLVPSDKDTVSSEKKGGTQKNNSDWD